MNLYNIESVKHKMIKEHTDLIVKYIEKIKECFCCKTLADKTDACIPFVPKNSWETLKIDDDDIYGHIMLSCKYCGTLHYCPYCGEEITHDKYINLKEEL